MKDNRASWCSIQYLHGPHGAKSPEPCPGYTPDQARLTKGPKTMPTTAADVRRAVAKLSVMAKMAGVEREFRYIPGSGSMGIAHVLEEYREDSTIPHVIKIGRTYAEAERYLEAMADGLDIVRRANALQAEEKQQSSRVALAKRGSTWIPLAQWTKDQLRYEISILSGKVGSADRIQVLQAELDRPRAEAGWPPQDS
jgi:hypothetical protein